MSQGRLLVEGMEDKRVFPELLEKAGIPWGPRGGEIVDVHAFGGFQSLTAEELEAQLKNRLERLAIIVDADDDPAGRWKSLQNTTKGWFTLPEKPQSRGTIIEVPPGHIAICPSLRRFGVWMMPDNQLRGMLETFLLALRPDREPGMFDLVAKATDEARTLGVAAAQASGNEELVFKQAHRDKALIHTWLAWHGDPPGRQLHQALMENLMDKDLTYAAPFVAWFKEVFEV